jgi:hypothetical protein
MESELSKNNTMPSAISGATESPSNLMGILNECITEVVNLITDTTSKDKIKQEIISPLLQILFNELYPYVCILVILMIITLILNTFSFIILIILYLNYKKKV